MSGSAQDRGIASSPPRMIRSVLVSGERVMLVRVALEEGAEVARHSHPHEQASYVAEGTVHFTIGERELALGQGQAVLIPSGEPHEVLAISSATVIDVFSPPREDLLP